MTLLEDPPYPLLVIGNILQTLKSDSPAKTLQ